MSKAPRIHRETVPAFGTNCALLRAVSKFLSTLLGLSCLIWVTDSSACTCRSTFSLVDAEKRGIFNDPSREIVYDLKELVLDPTQPILFVADDWDSDPQLFYGDKKISYTLERLEDDDLCGGDIFALFPDIAPRTGERYTLVSPDIQKRALEYQASLTDEEKERDAERQAERSSIEYDGDDGELQFSFGDAASLIETELTVSVNWVRSWPYEMSGGGCYANALTPYQGYGSARVEILSSDDVAFSATVGVVLPEGEPYQEAYHSRWRVNDKGDGYEKLSGARLTGALPLTRSGDQPECITVSVYDQGLESIFEQEFCPDPESYGQPWARETFAAQLAPLPEYPSRIEKEDTSGCNVAHRPGSNLNGLWLLAFGSFLMRRLRLS